TKYITELQVVESVFCQCRVKSIFELGALPDEHHPRAGQIPLIPQFPGWNPDGRQRPTSLQTVESTNVEAIGLIDLPHHELGLAGVHKSGHAACRLDLVHDPIPITDRL